MSFDHLFRDSWIYICRVFHTNNMAGVLSEVDTCNIQKVLSYWFAGDQQINYKTKWFPDGSTAFQTQADSYVQENFGELFLNAIEGQLQHWQHDKKGCVALIIVLDQFSRHICRLKGKDITVQEQRRADELALEIAKRFHALEGFETLQLSIAEYVFSLMPLRHTATVSNLSYVLERLDGKEAVETRAAELLNRFRKQTVRRLQHLQDRERLEATEDILEREAFKVDEADVMSHPLVRTTEAFLAQHLGLPVALTSTGKGKAGKLVASRPATEGESVEPYITLLISLSGGVDSMVIAKILRLIQQHRPQMRIRAVLAMHIDYGNRPESAAEAAYVQRWCAGSNNEAEGLLGGVVCKVRRVAEVTRGVTNRDEYEKVSRDIRYGFYRACIEEVREAGQGTVSGVMFGHHLGDVQENVISNVMRGCGPLQLSGMTACSVTNGVAVWRPLLAHCKDEIFDFAHRFGVPYFKDSTPSWSTRGKLRSQLLPLLLDMYGAGCLQNLAQLAQESDATRDLVQHNLYAPFLGSVQRSPCGLAVNVLPYRQQPQCFWREALRQIMHSMDMGMVRDKAVGNFVERLQRPTATVLPGWLELRKGVHSLLTMDSDLVVLKEGVLRKNVAAVLSSTTLNQRRQQLVSQARRARDGERSSQTTLQQLQASLSIARAGQVCIQLDLLSGRLSYSADDLAALRASEFPDAPLAAAGEGSSPAQVLVGPWRITLTVCSAPVPNSLAQLNTLAGVLPGYFSYTLAVPGSCHACTMLPLYVQFQLDTIRSLQDEVRLYEEITASAALVNADREADSEGSGPAVVVAPEGLAAVEGRLRGGLPLLVLGLLAPGATQEDRAAAQTAQCCRWVRVSYTYISSGSCV